MAVAAAMLRLDAGLEEEALFSGGGGNCVDARAAGAARSVVEVIEETDNTGVGWTIVASRTRRQSAADAADAIELAVVVEIVAGGEFEWMRTPPAKGEMTGLTSTRAA